MSQAFHSAEIVATKEGRQYHIGLAPGEVASYILMCGDPKRVEKAARLLDKKAPPIKSREYVTVTGKYKGIPVSVMATGMGPDNTEIAVVELSQIVANPTFIRIGSSGALKKGIAIGDLVISTGAVRLENTSTYFVIEGYPAIANHEVIIALLASVSRLGVRYHLGLTATAPGFYGAQGRSTPHFIPRDPELPAKLDKMNVSNFEMEASALFTLATLGGFRAGAVCAIYAQRHENKFIDKDTMARAELNCIKAGLGAVEALAKMDATRGKRSFWLPSLGL